MFGVHQVGIILVSFVKIWQKKRKVGTKVQFIFFYTGICCFHVGAVAGSSST